MRIAGHLPIINGLFHPVYKRNMTQENEFRFLKACRGETTDVTPIWFMRQAGRYMKAYRDLKEKYTFLEMCKNPELAAEVTLQPLDVLGVDAAIIFADILLPLEPMGTGLEFTTGDGPVIPRPVKGMKDIENLRPVNAEEDLGFVGDAIHEVRKQISGKMPLIGFAGAPFTLCSYMIEGGKSRDFKDTKLMMFEAPEMWNLLMDKVCTMLIDYLKMQVKAGAQALQIFDSRVCLGVPRAYCFRHLQSSLCVLFPPSYECSMGCVTALCSALPRCRAFARFPRFPRCFPRCRAFRAAFRAFGFALCSLGAFRAAALSALLSAMRPRWDARRG